MLLKAGCIDQAQECFAKALNVEMFMAVLVRAEADAETVARAKADFVERLTTAGMNEQAGDLLDPKADFLQAIECYLRANCFEKAIKLCYGADAGKVES